ncbi:UNVERIFIED_CONTAM: hypothetical protein FKN15_052290 [Acipenser sinensis]
MPGFYPSETCKASLPSEDKHGRCSSCLGPEHAKEALVNRSFCGHPCTLLPVETENQNRGYRTSADLVPCLYCTIPYRPGAKVTEPSSIVQVPTCYHTVPTWCKSHRTDLISSWFRPDIVPYRAKVTGPVPSQFLPGGHPCTLLPVETENQNRGYRTSADLVPCLYCTIPYRPGAKVTEPSSIVQVPTCYHTVPTWCKSHRTDLISSWFRPDIVPYRAKVTGPVPSQFLPGPTRPTTDWCSCPQFPAKTVLFGS